MFYSILKGRVRKMSIVEQIILFSAIILIVIGYLLSVLPMTAEPEQDNDYDEETDTWRESC